MYRHGLNCAAGRRAILYSRIKTYYDELARIRAAVVSFGGGDYGRRRIDFHAVCLGAFRQRIVRRTAQIAA